MYILLIPLIASVVLVSLYVGGASWRMRGLPESISAMVYVLKGGWRWLWSVWLTAVSVLTFSPAIEILDGRGLGIIPFLAMVSLGFVAVFPLFDTGHARWHNVFGIASGFLSQLCVCLICPYWMLLWSAMALLSYRSMHADDFPAWLDRRGVLVAEVVCYLSLTGAMMTHVYIT